MFSKRPKKKKEEEIKVKALMYKDVDLYTANICWKRGGGKEDKLVQVNTSLLLASCHLWDRDPTTTERDSNPASPSPGD